MTTAALAIRRHPAHATVVWALALLLALQGLASAVLLALGPAHAHQPQPLTGFQLWAPVKAQVQATERHVLGALGHFHASASPQRHHHQAGDASVVFDNPVHAAGDGDADEGASPSGLMLALLPPVAARHATAQATVPAWRPLWACVSGFASRLERPPRTT